MSNHKNKITTTLGCGGGSCTRPKPSAVYDPKPRRRRRHSAPATTTTTTSSAATATDFKALRAVHGFGRIDGESVAVEKDSDDPYHDFRRSMLQMILQRDICTREDLKVLLNCFLQLNSPYYHGIIVRAFSEIWYAIFAARQLVSSESSQLIV